MPEDGEAPVTREEYEALLRRVKRLEAMLEKDAPPARAPPEPRPAPPVWSAPPPPPPVQYAPPPTRAPAASTVPMDAFSRTPPPVTYTAPPPGPTPAPPVRAPAPPHPPAAAPRREVSVESLLGQRWAPRVGALLVFLATLFFLGVAIQRGWIGPLGQLGLAALSGAGLLAAGAVLTRKRGYGVYPQILEGTGASVLYVTAFVAHVVPHFSRHTNLTDVTGGLLMALVAAGTVALALRRDARVIAGLGYTLSFLTAGFGTTAMPALTLAYVALLGASLAWLVQRKAWHVEALLGTAATGAVFLVVALAPARAAAPSAWWVLACALPPLAAFAWLTLQPARARADGEDALAALMPPGVALLTLVWGVMVGVQPVLGWAQGQGIALLLACAVAAGLSVAAVARRAHAGVALVYGGAATLLYLAWPILVWRPYVERDLLATLSYAAGSLLLSSLALAYPRLRRTAALLAPAAALAAAAVASAMATDGVLRGPAAAPGALLGPWQAWVAFAFVGTALAALHRTPYASVGSKHRGPAVALGTVFAAAWVFALFHAPLAVTAALVVLAGGALAAGLRGQEWFGYAALAFLTVATWKAAEFDAGLPTAVVYAEGVLLAVALLALARAVALPGLRVGGEARLALAAAAVVLYAFALVALWRDVPYGRFAATTALALGGLALGLLARRDAAPANGWRVALALGFAAAAHAVLREGRLVLPWDASSSTLGGLEAWATLLLVGAAFALVLASTRAGLAVRRVALGGLLAFLVVWAFALVHAPFLATLALLLVAGLAAAAGALLPADGERSTLARDALMGAALVVAVAAVKGATFDAHGPRPLPWTLAALEAALTAGALLALHHLARGRSPVDPRASGAVLVGGSALVLANVVLAYATGPLPSILLAAIGVAYLAAGFVLRREVVHRYTGFALLGFVLVRVFAVDLNETDLAVRALVFAVLGAILLGVGYAYARLNRKEEPAPPATVVEADPPG